MPYPKPMANGCENTQTARPRCR